MEKTMLKCQCGTSLIQYGLYLYCPACKNLYYSQDSQSLQQFSDHYYGLHYSYPQFVEQIIENIIPNAPLKLFDNLHGITKETLIVPYVNLFVGQKDSLYPIIKQEANSVWKAEDIPVIEDFISFNLSHETVPTLDKSIKTADCDLQKLEELRMEYGYVSNEVYYIPMHILKFTYNGDCYCFVNYGGNIVSLGTSPDNLTMTSNEAGIKISSSVVHLLKNLLIVGFIACSWYVSCYTFQSIYGLFNLFWYAVGYKCIFKFLGLALVSIIGVCCLENSVRYMSGIIREKNGTRITEIHKSRLKSKAFSILSIQTQQS